MSSGLVSLWFVPLHQQQHQKKNRVYLEKKEGGSFFAGRRQTARAFLLWSSKRGRITKYIRSVATGGAPSLPSTGSVFALLGLLFYNFGLSATTCAPRYCTQQLENPNGFCLLHCFLFFFLLRVESPARWLKIELRHAKKAFAFPTRYNLCRGI